jgi:hypothetical protein
MQDISIPLGPHLGAVSHGVLAARSRDDDVMVRMSTRFELQYFEGRTLKWRAHTKNRVVTAGLNRVLNAALVTGNVLTTTASESVGTGTGSTTTFNHTLAGIASSTGVNPKVVPGSVTITAGSVVATDNGAGALSGTGIASGTINYGTGAVSITYSAAPANALAITAGYSVFASPALYIGLAGPSVSDGAMTASAPNLACTTSTPFQSQDVGRAIIVRGAGASSGDLVTTILTFTDSGHVVLNANASTTVSTANVIFDARTADTMASHAPWSELAAYSQATRPRWNPGAVSAGSVDNSADNSGVGAIFSINANNSQVGGIFLSDNSTISGASGLLYGMAPFGVPGFQQMNNGGTLNVIATATAASQ